LGVVAVVPPLPTASWRSTWRDLELVTRVDPVGQRFAVEPDSAARVDTELAATDTRHPRLTVYTLRSSRAALSHQDGAGSVVAVVGVRNQRTSSDRC
jgi:hypothetical protein